MAYLGRPGATAPLTSADIPDNSITAAKIVADTIAAGDLAPNSVDSSELVDGSIDASHLASNIAISTSGAITTTGGLTVDDATVIEDNDGASTSLVINNSNTGTSTDETTELEFQHKSIRAAKIVATKLDSFSSASQYSSGLQFITTSSNVENVGITQNHAGRVGIGTDTPQGLVVSRQATDVVDAINFVAEGYGDVSDTCGYYFASHAVDSPKRKAAIILRKTGDFGVGDLHFLVDSTGDDNNVAHNFNNDTKMTIQSDGRVGIGVPINSTSITAGLHVREVDDDKAGVRIFKYGTTTGSSQIFIRFARNDTGGNESGHGQIVGSGTNAAAFATWSDERIKENIVDAPSQLDVINQLKVREFNFIRETEREIGFIAQEFEKVLPDAIAEEDDEIKTKYIVGWSTSDARMVSAIQELSAKNDALEAENTALKTRMDALEARVTALEG